MCQVHQSGVFPSLWSYPDRLRWGKWVRRLAANSDNIKWIPITPSPVCDERGITDVMALDVLRLGRTGWTSGGWSQPK